VGKVVVLNLNKGQYQQDYNVSVAIAQDGEFPFASESGTLPKSLEVSTNHENWRATYQQLDVRRRLGTPQRGRTSNNAERDCRSYAQALEQSMKAWFNISELSKIKDALSKAVYPHDEIRILIQTEDHRLRRLPWHLFFDTFLDQYPNAEVALSPPSYHQPPLSPVINRNQVRILAVLGDSQGIEVNKDEQLLKKLLPDAEITFLVEPHPTKLHDCLWDEKGWDIFFFAGHSHSDDNAEKGYMNISKTEKLQISQLKNALKKALKQGLQLAIFNSCDGLGLASNLTELHIPQIIVMREPVPDNVAQAFLRYFLTEYSSGKSLYLAVREARERLEGLDFDIPGAAWLPVIYQLPTQIPPTWQQLCRTNNAVKAPQPNNHTDIASSQQVKVITNSSSPKLVSVSTNTRSSSPKLTPANTPNSTVQTSVTWQKLSKDNSYPAYQVFGVICGLYQYGIATPAEILPLCLPEYSQKVIQKVVDDFLSKKLGDLVISITQGKYERLAISGALDPQKVMPAYGKNSLEKYVTAAIAALDATKETHQRWASHALRSLAINNQDNIVRKILLEYPEQILNLQPKQESSEWSVWIKMYEALLQKQPDDVTVRSKCLLLISRHGTSEQKSTAIAETVNWLEKHPLDMNVRAKYLNLIEKCGNVEQKQNAIVQTRTWLQAHQEKFNIAIGKDKKIRTELNNVLQKIINIVFNTDIKNKDQILLLNIFAYFREYLNDGHCNVITDYITKESVNLPVRYWAQLINAANIFRDYRNDFAKAESIYKQVLNSATSGAKKTPTDANSLSQTIQYTYLHYARLLILKQPSNPDKALDYLGRILANNQKHALAHSYIAKCYQLKGKKFNKEASYSFEKAIELDKQLVGHFWYEYGVFQLETLANKNEARKSFENSLKQKINLRACVDLAELEIQHCKFKRASELLDQACTLERVTRMEKEQWRQFQNKIQLLKNKLPN
jgi:tetratricopeptide (TPR) repeat protein